MTRSATVQPAGDDVLRIDVAAYLSRYKGLFRYHTESDLRVFLRWLVQPGHKGVTGSANDRRDLMDRA